MYQQAPAFVELVITSYSIHYTKLYDIVGKDGIILRTTNAGTVWQSIDPVTTVDLNDVYFIDKQTGVAVGDKGIILRTVDGGRTWTHVSSPTEVNLEGVMFPTAQIGTIVGMNGCILRSTDGGQSWIDRITSYNVCYTKLLRTASVRRSLRSGPRQWRCVPIGLKDISTCSPLISPRPAITTN